MHFSAYASLAIAVATVTLARPMPQIGGDAQACYGIVNNVDNGSGYAVENAEDNVADLWSGKPTGSDSEGNGAGGSPTQRKMRRDLVLIARQLNKISAGLGNLGDAFGVSQVTDPIVNDGDLIDTVGTNGQGQLGDSIGDFEDSAIPGLANDATNLDPSGSLPPLKNLVGTGAVGGAGAAPAPAGGAAPAPAPAGGAPAAPPAI